MAEDYYKVLEVGRNASQAEIQKAYRELARKHHPDLNPDDKSAKEKFQRVQQAYDVLNDRDKREMYDRYGSSFESMGAGGPQGAGTWQTHTTEPSSAEGFDFSQFFGERFGAHPGGGTAGGGGGFADIFKQFSQSAGRPGRARVQPRRGTDLRHDLKVSLKTAIAGGDARLAVHRAGGGTETITVKIPPGIEDGKTIRLRGQGEPAAGGGQRGDILISIHVQPHPFFERRGKHLDVKVPVTLAEAALGAKVDVPTPRGTISLKIPSGTSSGKKLRIKGHGVAADNGEPGDLMAEIQIVLPPSLDEQSIDWIRKLDEHQTIDPRSKLKW